MNDTGQTIKKRAKCQNLYYPRTVFVYQTATGVYSPILNLRIIIYFNNLGAEYAESKIQNLKTQNHKS